jgi:HlyD family secretion protein
MNKSKKTLIISASVITALVILILIYIFVSHFSSVKLYSVETKQGTITEKINLTGQVKASQGVDMAFESSGKITANYVKTGDKIYAGQPLISIDSSILQAQLQQAQANADALNINIVQSKADSGLQTAYTSALGYAQKSVTVAKNSVIVITDIQYNHFLNQTNENINIKNIKAQAVYSLLGKEDAGTWNSESISKLDEGAFGSVQAAVNNPTNDNIDTALLSTLSALEDVRKLIDAIPVEASLTTAERTSLVTEKTYIASEIITIQNSIQSISSQKINNDAAITTTNSQLNAAKANVDIIKAQIAKTTLRALFDGQVDKNDAIVGNMTTAGNPVITISNNNLEIQTNIPESEVANVKIGDKAEITLDAYGTNEIFQATVVSIDSVQTLSNGISVYKARLKFNDNNEKIKSGMTANITILPATHSDVLIVPKSAVIQNNGKYFVIVETANSKTESREVTIGIKDENNIEITSGLALGEKVLAY